MAMRFRRSIKIAPGIKVNFNKNSIGVSVGPKGAHVSVNSKGQKSESIGIPGTGLSYVNRSSAKKSQAAIAQQPLEQPAKQKLTSEQAADNYVETVQIEGQEIRYANMQIELPEDMITEFRRLCAQNGDHVERVVGEAVENYIEKCKHQN
jgi:hypothetical protein